MTTDKTAPLSEDNPVVVSTLTPKGRWKFTLAMLPGIGAAVLTKFACPACWPAYAGFLSSIGLGFLVNTEYLLPITTVFLAFSVGVLALRARRRRGYGPFAVGAIAAPIVLVSQFYFHSDPVMYAGLALLISASVWNSWPIQSSSTHCSSCDSGDYSATQTARMSHEL